MSVDISPSLHLVQNICDIKKISHEAIRQGFGRGMLELGKINHQVVGLSADLTESTQMHFFAQAYPERFVQVGVAEQNLVTVASGLASMGKIPFASSFAAFSPGRNWEQIRTTICYNNQPVKIIGSHSGLSAGPDGATHQVLEDIALMRVLPNMVVVVPADAEQTYQATLAIAQNNQPSYLRLVREKTPVFTTPTTPFILGKAQVLTQGSDLTIVACGPSVHQAILAAELCNTLSIEVINVHTIKPFDVATVVASAQKTGRVMTIEEHQIAGGLGSVVAETLAEHAPTPLMRLGVRDRFGESGSAQELWNTYGLSAESIQKSILAYMNKTK